MLHHLKSLSEFITDDIIQRFDRWMGMHLAPRMAITGQTGCHGWIPKGCVELRSPFQWKTACETSGLCLSSQSKLNGFQEKLQETTIFFIFLIVHRNWWFPVFRFSHPKIDPPILEVLPPRHMAKEIFTPGSQWRPVKSTLQSFFFLHLAWEDDGKMGHIYGFNGI